MWPLLKKWVFFSKQAYKNETFNKFLRVIKVDKILLKVHHKTLEWFCIYEYGPSFKYNRIGELTVHGAKFKFYDPQLEYLSQAFSGETYEPAVTYHLKSLIGNRKLRFLDIGAHFGFYTLYAASLNKNCEIYAFEPNKEFFRILNENVRINNIKAKLYELALSDKSGEIPFSNRSMKVNGQSDIVNSIPFDELQNEEHIYPDIVKIDVHGGEGKVLYGMKKALKSDIKHLYCELHPQDMLVDYSLQDILDILIKSEFELFEINRFRKENTPQIVKISDSLYDNIINEEKWTKIQKEERRMIYARKGRKIY